MTANNVGCPRTRRSQPSQATRFLRLALATLLLLGAFCGQAFAQTCDFVAIGPTTATGPASGSVGFTLQGQTACSTTITGTLVVTADSTGGATVGPTPFTATLDTDFNFNVALGNLPGGTGTVIATCTSGGCAGDQLLYTFNTANNYAYIATTPTTITTNQLSSFTLGTNLLINGAPGTLQTQFTNVTNSTTIATVAPNGAGTATQTTSIAFPAGAYLLRGTIVCPIIAPDAACNATAPVDYNVAVEATGVTRVSPAAQPGVAGVPLTLTARLGGATTTAPDGNTLLWSVTQPAGGDGALSGTTTTVGGNSSSTLTATVPGTYTVTALTTCTFCTPTSTTFNVTIAAVVRTLAVVSGNGQTAPTGAALPAPLVVLAQDNGTNAPGITVNWTTTSGTLSAPSSVTNAAGQASINLTLGAAPGPVTVTGTRADDGTAIATFTVNGTLTRTLTLVSGNNQSGAPGATLPLPLTVEARNNGTVAGGVGINYQVTSGTGTLAPTSATTSGAGIASSTLTLGAAAGTVTVRAARQDDLTVFVDFTMSAGKLAALPGLTASGRAVAVAVDKFCPALGTGPLADPNANDLRLRCNELIAAIGTDPAGVTAALEELYADVALVQSSSGLLAAQAQFDNIKARIAALRSGTRGVSFGGLALNNGRGSAPIGTLFDTMLADGADKEAGAEFQRWGFFAAGTIGRGDAERGIVNPAYDFDIKGLTAGVDYRYSDKWIFGGTLGYTRQDNTLTDAEGQLNTHGWSISGYTTYYQSNSWYSDAVLSYGSNRYEMERRLRYTFTLPGSLSTTVDQRSSADSDGTSLSFAGSFGRDFNHGAWGFGPYARLVYTKLNFDATTERMAPGSPGSGLALVIQTSDVTSVSSVLGGKLTYAHSANWGVLIPHLQAEWQHEFKDDPSEVEAHFLYDPTATPFTITGDKLDTDFFRFGLGLSMVLTHGRSGFVYYEKLIGRDGFSQDNLALGLRIEF